MGVWNTPISNVKTARMFAKKLEKPWLVKLDNEGEGTLPDSFNIIGDDIFQDEVWSCKEGRDLRLKTVRLVETWIKNKDCFVKYSEKALVIVEQATAKYYRGE